MSYRETLQLYLFEQGKMPSDARLVHFLPSVVQHPSGGGFIW